MSNNNDDDAEMADVQHQVAQASLADRDDENDDSNEESSDDSDSEEEDDILQNLPPLLLARVQSLQELNTQRDSIMEQYLQERAALEVKYRTLCEPLYEQRAKVVRGDCDGEIQVSTNDSTDDDDDEPPPKGIPQFWVCAMGHMEDVAELLTEEDVDCLEHLTDIQCHEMENGKGFRLEFHFNNDTNPYFTNAVLTKRYTVPNLLVADEPILKNVQGCEIDWKDADRCLTFRTVEKKQRGKGKHGGKVRTVRKQERQDSFFHFFSPPKLPSMEEMDEDEAERLEEAFDADYDVAQALRLHVCPKAVLWFTGQGMEEEMQQAMEEEEEVGDEVNV